MPVWEKVSLMGVNERQVALAVLEHLREDILKARTKDGTHIVDQSDMHQYLTEQIDCIRGGTMDVTLGGVVIHASQPLLDLDRGSDRR
jgi:hypothetical protein